MNVYSFKQHNRCDMYPIMKNIVKEGDKGEVFRRGIKTALPCICAKLSRKDVVKQLFEFLRTEYQHLQMPFSWQISTESKNDASRFNRFLLWFESTGWEPVKCFCSPSISLPILLPDGTYELFSTVHMLCKEFVDGKEIFHAVIIDTGKSFKGLKGRSVATNISTDLVPLVAKLGMEEKYPGIVVDMIYLTHESDTTREIGDKWIENSSANSMHYSLDYASYYENGVLNREKLMDIAKDIVRSSGEKNCSMCSYFSLCKASPSFEEKAENKEFDSSQNIYKTPSFTAEQEEVVKHFAGPLCVFAGPGSGKTATLIGRIKYLIEEKGIFPGFILVVTFTNEAAAELKKRCLSFLSEDSLPKIATLNSFCYEIIRDNTDVFGRKLTLLNNTKKYELIESLVSVFPPLYGFNYGQKGMENHLFLTIARKLDEYFSTDEEYFFHKNSGKVGTDFKVFAEQYKEIVKLNGYITFDEQISLTNKLFSERPDILEIYQNVYQYIMVDECQDVNDDQVELLCKLADRHHNLVVVGDDDQGIYAFRGGSPKFMLEFKTYFPDAKNVVFTKNFRSTKSLVDASSELIKKNRYRMEKQITAGVKNMDTDKVPVLVNSISPGVITDIIEGLLKEGYEYQDIAILCGKNKPLDELHSSLQLPTVLAKSFLRLDGLFLLIYSIIRLGKNIDDDTAFYMYMKLYGKEKYVERNGTCSLHESLMSYYGINDVDNLLIEENESFPCAKPLQDLHGTFLPVYKEITDIPKFINTISLYVNWTSSDAASVLIDEIKKQGISTFEEFEEYVMKVVSFEDDTRVVVDRGDKILLITNHDSKGKEFKVVLLYGGLSDSTEESRRVLYVAITRAKERLYILQDEADDGLLQEIPHMKMMVQKEVN